MAPKVDNSSKPAKAEMDKDIAQIEKSYEGEEVEVGEMADIAVPKTDRVKRYRYDGENWNFFKLMTKAEAEADEGEEDVAAEEKKPSKKAAAPAKKKAAAKSDEDEEAEPEKPAAAPAKKKAVAPAKKKAAAKSDDDEEADESESSDESEGGKKDKAPRKPRVKKNLEYVLAMMESGKVDKAKSELKNFIEKHGADGGKPKKEKGTRAPTPYNKFMKKKMEELKASGDVASTERMKAAVAFYTKMKNKGMVLNDDGDFVAA